MAAAGEGGMAGERDCCDVRGGEGEGASERAGGRGREREGGRQKAGGVRGSCGTSRAEALTHTPCSH